MLQPIDDATRRKLLSVSALLCATSLFLAPIAGRSSIEFAEGQPGADRLFPIPKLPPFQPLRPLALTRDPFVTTMPARVTTAADAGAASGGVVGIHVVQGAGMGIAVPFGTTIVRAIVTGGTAPRALVETGGRTQIISIGDNLDGSTVTEIDPTGIRLANGTKFRIEASR